MRDNGRDEPGAAGRPPSVTLRPRAVRVALLGLGTVGAGVVQLLAMNGADIERKVGRGVVLSRALVRDLDKPRLGALPDGALTTDPEAVLGDPQVDVVIEVMGGTRPALDYVLRSLRSGRPVVTANKDIMAEHGRVVWQAAAEGRTDVFFEASVGGGVPIVRALKESLAANRVRRLAGILNGTTNFILTRMAQQGVSQERALADARALGYAEADPSADIDGLDAARKLAILSSIAYNARCLPRDVFRQGIREVGAADVAYAARMGWVIKLLALSELRADGVSMRVHPMLLPGEHPLAAVHDTFNAVYVQGDAVGEAMFYGRGAGALPTASAVLGDLMLAARFLDRGGAGTGCTCFREHGFVPLSSLVSRFYVRLRIVDRVGVLAQIAGVFGRAGVSILSVQQTPLPDGTPAGPAREGEATGGEEHAELILTTHEVREDWMAEAITGIARLDVVSGVGAVLRLAPGDL